MYLYCGKKYNQMVCVGQNTKLVNVISLTINRPTKKLVYLFFFSGRENMRRINVIIVE